MWVVTEFGFFSIVKNRDGAGLLVRARVRADLGRLLEKEREVIERHLPEGAKFPSIKDTPTADYPFRVIMPEEAVADVLWLAVRRIDYPNFKSRVGARHGYEREGVYLRVWSDLRDLERENRPQRETDGFEVFSDQGELDLASPGNVGPPGGLPEGRRGREKKSRKGLKSRGPGADT